MKSKPPELPSREELRREALAELYRPSVRTLKRFLEGRADGLSGASRDAANLKARVALEVVRHTWGRAPLDRQSEKGSTMRVQVHRAPEESRPKCGAK